MKRILVTGATGFIGSHVVGELLRLGYSVIASSSDPVKAKSWGWYSRATYLPLDLSRMDGTTDYWSYFLRPDVLIHLAWEGLPNYRNLFHFEDNLPRHYRFLKNMVLHGIKDVTVAGTCLEYGMREGLLREDMPAMPGTAYGLAKDTLRKFLVELGKEAPFDLKWPRLFYVYGPGQHPRSLFAQLDRAIADGEEAFPMSMGEQERDYLPVSSVAEYLCKIALQDKIHGIVNCCSGRPVVLRRAVEDYVLDKGSPMRLQLGVFPYPDYEPMAFWGDTTKLRKALEAGQ